MFSEDIPKCPWKGPTGHWMEATSQHSENTWEMMVNPDVYGCTGTLNIPKNAKTQQPTENQSMLKTTYTAC